MAKLYLNEIVVECFQVHVAYENLADLSHRKEFVITDVICQISVSYLKL